VYVADSGHDAVDVLSFANRSVTRWTGSLRSPTAIAPGRNGLVYVADSTSLYAFSPAGHVVTRIIARVSGLATDGRGSLVLAAHLPSISKTDWNGKAEAVFSIETGAVDAVAVSEYGTIYALDSSASRLYVIGSGGTVIQRLGGRGSGSGQLSSPRALAVGAGGRVYVADTGNNRVDEFAPSTK
jgi:DNA-binding beta-propeller fold protein YncE